MLSAIVRPAAAPPQRCSSGLRISMLTGFCTLHVTDFSQGRAFLRCKRYVRSSGKGSFCLSSDGSLRPLLQGAHGWSSASTL